MRTTATCALLVVLSAAAGRAQGVPFGRAVQGRPPSADQLARRVVTLRLQLESIRGALERSDRRGARGAGDEWRPVGWADSLAALRHGLAELDGSLRRLEQAHRSAGRADSARQASPLSALIGGVDHALDSLARATAPAAARTAGAHAAARLAALLERIEEGEPVLK